MAARKPNMTPAPKRPELDALIEKAMGVSISEEQLAIQRASFVYGNAPRGSKITKKSARRASQTVLLRSA